VLFERLIARLIAMDIARLFGEGPCEVLIARLIARLIAMEIARLFARLLARCLLRGSLQG